MEINEQALAEAFALVETHANVPNLQKIVMGVYSSLVKAEKFGYFTGFNDGVADEQQRQELGAAEDEGYLLRAAAALDGEAENYFMYNGDPKTNGEGMYSVKRVKGTGVEGEELDFGC
jgi:hypothetical protein